MTCSQRQAIKRWLAIGLAAANLAAMPIGRAESVTRAPATMARESSDQPELDVEALVAEAERLKSQADYAGAAAIWQQLLNYAERTYGPNHRYVATCLNNLAELLKEQGLYTVAEPLFRRSLTIRERALGPDHLDVAASLNNLALLLESQEQFAAAELLYRRSLIIAEKSFGLDHPGVALILISLAGVLDDQGQHGAAEPILRRALAIQEKVLGPDHPDVALILTRLAWALSDQGQHGTAEPLLRRALAIEEKNHAPDHPDIAVGLLNLAIELDRQKKHSEAEPHLRRSLAIYENNPESDYSLIENILSILAFSLQDQGNYVEAEPLLRRALAIKERVLGLDHPDIVSSLDNLASLLSDQAKYSAAEPLYRRSLAIRETTFGLDHPDVAQSLNNLALLLYSQGQYSAADPYLRRSLAIRETTLGTDHPDVAQSLNNLAELLRSQGQFEAAEPLFRRSLAIREKVLGPDHPDFARSLNSLGLLLFNQGKYSAAYPYMRRSNDILEKILGADHPEVATSLNNVATLLRNQGQFEAAEPLFRRSLAIREKVLGPDHPDFARSLNSLGILFFYQGKYGAAEAYIRRSISILESVFGEDHPEVARSLNSLAVLLNEQEKHSAAEPLIRRSLAIREKTLAPDHPDLAESLNNLAVLMYNQGNKRDANEKLSISIAINEKVLGSGHPALANSLGDLAFLLGEQGQHDNAIRTLDQSLAIQSNWQIRELPMLANQARSGQQDLFHSYWELAFGWITSHPLAANLALETRLKRQGLLQEIEQRQALLLNTPGIDPAKVQQLQALTQQLTSVTLPAEHRAALRQQRDALQVQIYRLQPDLAIQTVTISEVTSALPADAALVEIQRYRPWAGGKSRQKFFGDPEYIALVLKPNGTLSTVPLGAAAPIDATVIKALSASAENLSDTGALWAQLSEQLLKPLLPQLRGSRQWFLSPDGELNRVPFAALPAPQQPNQLLADVVQLRVLTTGRDLVRLQTTPPKSRASLVMANPSFDRGGSGSALASALNSQPGPQRRSADLSSTRWDPLPGTEREGQQVAALLGAPLLSGPAATATALNQQVSPQVLHIATHGFFLADQDTPPTDPLRVVQEQMGTFSALRTEVPLLRSGLVLAGANQPGANPDDDGHLTAAEALMLNLKGTELVVLSACSTGQGEVRTGEGVYGLQRALTVAGARSTLLSLWKVDDAATAEFMVRFYRRLKAGEGRADALAAVQADFRNGSVKGHMGEDWSRPYFWAAWQLVGDWRPIQGL